MNTIEKKKKFLKKLKELVKITEEQIKLEEENPTADYFADEGCLEVRMAMSSMSLSESHSYYPSTPDD